MTAAGKFEFIAIDDYLAGELEASIKHEFAGGVVYAMAGGSNRHNRISLNICSTLREKLRGKPCQPFNSDTKVRIRQSQMTRFYFPDVQADLSLAEIYETLQFSS